MSWDDSGVETCRRCGNVFLEKERCCRDLGMCPECVKYREEARREALEKAERYFKREKRDCYKCDGRGYFEGENNRIDCPSCDGDGWVWTFFDPKNENLSEYYPSDFDEK